ncbi:MAG: lantibiotic dehydratase, partial [Holophagales bacterium]|nr:lantibiotic dehydratase [Holophagales bacterium]
DVERLLATGPPPLPDAFHVMASVAAASSDALAAGEASILLRHAGGPSGANLLGRFCHGDPELGRQVEAYLRQEELRDPEAIFAEVVHLPQGRTGNVLLRPLLRSHEIPFLGRSGAPRDKQIPITDLEVSVEGGRVVLRSASLGRRIVPRLTSAHNYTHGAIGLYRFLGLLQQQGFQGGLSWRWGALDCAPFLPRIRRGRLVLDRARWRVLAPEIRDLTSPESDAERYGAVARWRRERGLPRLVALVDGDNELAVDLDNALSVDTFLAVIRKRNELMLTELFPPPGELCAEGPEGRFTHELVIPYLRRRDEPAAGLSAAEESAMAVSVSVSSPRVFPPGSEWLYAKLYTGTATADGVLAGVVAPLVHELQYRGVVDRWFFLRYADPRWHLRLRLHGEPARLAAEALPLLHRAAAPALDDGRIWRLQLDTYERELDRYGHGDGIELSEGLFSADSDAVLAIVGCLEGDAHADSRWLLAARGLDRLASDLGFGPDGKLELLETLQRSYAREHGVGPAIKKQLADRLRRERPRLRAALGRVYDADHPLAEAHRAIDRRSRALAPIAEALRSAEAAGRLGVPLRELALSYLHMFANRLLRAQSRAQEMVLYDFLAQHHRSEVARARAASRARRSEVPESPSTQKRAAHRAAGGRS